MELKEMADTAVIINNVDELKEYLQICEDGGWTAIIPKKCSLSYGYPSCLETKDRYKWNGSCSNKITLAQFKERNGIMKYREGGVLVSGGSELEIQGSVGKVYIVVDGEGHGATYSECELDSLGYTLKTDEPELVELTLEDVAKLKGIPVETLRIKD